MHADEKKNKIECNRKIQQHACKKNEHIEKKHTHRKKKHTHKHADEKKQRM